MKTKKIFLLALVVLTGIASSCKYDDDELWDKVHGLTDRVVALEELTQKLNGDITAMQSIISALQKNVSVSSLEEVADGYIIHFTDGTKATIKHGKDGEDGKDGVDGAPGADGADGAPGADGADGADGEDGKDGVDGKDGANAPIIGVKKEGDIYYWTITTDGVTEWLKDDEGNMMPVTSFGGTEGSDGEDGKDGKDGISPEIKIVDGYWYVKNGSGAWTNTGKTATPEKGDKGDKGEVGDSYFHASKPIYRDGDVIVITLKNGETFAIPVADTVKITYNGDKVPSQLVAGIGDFTFDYTTSLTNISSEVLSYSKDVLSKVVVNDIDRTITVTPVNPGTAKIVILFYNDNQTITSVLEFDVVQ